MGHWSEALVDDLARDVGGSPDRQGLIDALASVGHEIDVLSGRNFHPAHHATRVFEPNGLPFVDVPDLRAGFMEATAGVWEVPDPASPEMTTVLQLASFDVLARKAVPIAQALLTAGHMVADAFRSGFLSREYILRWLGLTADRVQRDAIFRRLMDPAVQFHVPLLCATAGGWWYQIARRLIWVTDETEDDGRLVEPLLDGGTADGVVVPLVATEPILIAARLTRQSVDCAFAVRIWTEDVHRPIDRPWKTLARAIHGHGIPTITIDPNSTPDEMACQVMLKGYWHGYVGGDDQALAKAIEIAYPQPVARVRRDIGAPSNTSAAAALLEQLIHPGFDPARGAEATRRYVRRKANIVVMEQRKREAPDRYPWTQVGISERRFYKLLPRFAEKVNGRYDYDHNSVVERMKAELSGQERGLAVRAYALEVLRIHGFKDEAARKWLQRHRPEEALDAWPRSRKSADR
jgi:hypothetical protein